MEVIADPAVAPEIMSIVADPSHGTARQMFVLALGTVGYRDSIPTLIKLLEDGDVAAHAVMALGKMAAREASPMLERLATSGKPWVRKEAMKALKRIANSRE
jgi:HEAT repeat protein